jgi:hypothetical protein
MASPTTSVRLCAFARRGIVTPFESGRKGVRARAREISVVKCCPLAVISNWVRSKSELPGSDYREARRQALADHQTTFNANWICLDLVAVEVICPAPPMTAPLPSKMA